MFKKMGVNVVFLCCVVALPVFGVVNYPPLAGAQGLALDPDRGVDSYTKLMLHADGSDQGTSFTDSETTPKTVTNTESYDSYTKLMLHTEREVRVTNPNPQKGNRKNWNFSEKTC